MDDDRLFGGADHAVIECLAVYNRVDGQDDIGRVVDDSRSIARADAQSWFARRIRRFDHARAARCQDDIGFFHEEVCHFEARNVDPRDDVFGGSGGYCGIENDFSGGNRRFASARMRANDDGIARFEGD